ncbi:MAG TPA: ribosome small subunit-dependent GTPase A [Tepidisphaeraceae bacterium]|nr:ribosome small subunit-dependent GTPase A [Tepidisphaeraceae bacterium]
MRGKPKKAGRAKDRTADYLSGHVDEDRVETQQRFSDKSKHFQRRKTERTALLRAAEEAATVEAGDLEALPSGDVILVHSLYSQVEGAADHVTRLCVVRKTLAKVSDTGVVVGDVVRFRETGTLDDQDRPEAVIEQILPRRTLLTRADSFKAIESHPIVANAGQMLIVAALAEPWPKWGLIDRMLIAAQGGGLVPVLCLNKADLVDTKDGKREWEFAQAALAHYASIGVRTLLTSVPTARGLDDLRTLLAGKTTVLAGHSGVGKSSLIRAIQPALDLRIGAISGYTGKGRHTTTSAQRFALDGGGFVVDTPGVKLFGLWNVTPDNVADFFPDVRAGTAPEWRTESYQRIVDSLST